MEVRADAPTVGEILVTDSVEVKEEGFDGQNGDDVEIEGVVSRVISATDFEAVTATINMNFLLPWLFGLQGERGDG